MNLKKEELALYALNRLKTDYRPNSKYTKEHLSFALDISNNTLDLYMSKLKKDGFIIRHKKKYVDDFRQTFELTGLGKEKVIEIEEYFSKEVLTPERHNIPSIVKITTILTRIPDELEKIFFLSLYTRLKRFDLPFFLETMRTAKTDSNMVKVLYDIEKGEDKVDEVPIVEMFFKTHFFGGVDMDEMEKIAGTGSNVNTLLIVAEASIKQGRFDEARAIYDYLLSSKVRKNQNQWFMARAGQALMTYKIGDLEGAVQQLQEVIDSTDNKIQRTYANQLIARVYSTSGDHERSLELYNSVIRSSTALGIPLLLFTALNNVGVLYFRMDEREKAEEVWLKARKLTREFHYPYLEGPVLANLADVEMLKGNIEKSKKMLDDAWTKYEDVADFEGKAYVDLNYAFLYLEKKDLDTAITYFNKSQEIAFPLPSPRERKEMKEVFLERAERNGFNDIEKLIG